MSTSKKTTAEIMQEQIREEARRRSIDDRNQLASEKLRQAQLQNNTAQEGFFRPDMNSFRYAQKDNQGGFQQAVDFGVPSNIRRVQDELEDTSQYSPRSYTPADGMEDLDSNKFLGLYGDVISRMNSLGTRAAQAGYDINNLDISDPAQAQLFKEFNTLKNFGGELGTRLQNSRRIREEELKKGNINRSSDGGRGMQTADMYFSGNKWKERTENINGDAQAIYEKGAADKANKMIQGYRDELGRELSKAKSVGDDVLVETLRQEIASIQDVYYDPSKVREQAFKEKKYKEDNTKLIPDFQRRAWNIVNKGDFGDLGQYYDFKSVGEGKWSVTPKSDAGLINPAMFNEPVFIDNTADGAATVFNLMHNAKMTKISEPSAFADKIRDGELKLYNPTVEEDVVFDVKNSDMGNFMFGGGEGTDESVKNTHSLVKMMSEMSGDEMTVNGEVVSTKGLGESMGDYPTLTVGEKVLNANDIRDLVNNQIKKLRYSGNAKGYGRIKDYRDKISKVIENKEGEKVRVAKDNHELDYKLFNEIFDVREGTMHNKDYTSGGGTSEVNKNTLEVTKSNQNKIEKNSGDAVDWSTM
tara:strand:- start:2490 stop:4241 length:1752 start_codon:yes stop_codon:yes gene_type:complete